MGFLENHAARRTVENFIPTVSPYALAKPPDWFLDELAAYDPELRIFASLTDPLYRVMRHVRTSQPWTVFLKEKPDTGIAVRFGLYPVTSVNPQAILGFSWGRVLLHLQEHDQAQFPNADAVTRQLEGFEALSDRRIQSTQDDEADMRAIDLYRAYKGMNGERVSLAYRKPDGAGPSSQAGRPRRVYRPQNAGAGAFFTGRQAGAVQSAGRSGGRSGVLITGV